MQDFYTDNCKTVLTKIKEDWTKYRDVPYLPIGLPQFQ